MGTPFSNPGNEETDEERLQRLKKLRDETLEKAVEDSKSETEGFLKDYTPEPNEKLDEVAKELDKKMKEMEESVKQAEELQKQMEEEEKKQKKEEGNKKSSVAAA